MVSVKKNSVDYASFVYDGDGNRVKGTINGTTISYVGNYADWSGSSLTKYYYAGTVRIAMRQGNEVTYLLGDHLGSTSKTYRASDGDTKQQLYKPWGERRYPASSELPTTWRFTGQRHASEIGLYFYNARWYDPSVGRFMQGDQILVNPYDTRNFDRYSYVYNSPLRYTDPSGFCTGDRNNPLTEEERKCWSLIDQIQTKYKNIVIDPLLWESYELQVILDTLTGFPFQQDISGAKKITFYRQHAYPNRSPGQTVGGWFDPHKDHSDNPTGEYDIYIYDDAYIMLPDHSGTGTKSLDNFMGAVAHELAHVALFENPSIKSDYEQFRKWRWSGLSRGYPIIVEDPDAEYIAIATSAWVVDPNLLVYTTALFISVTWERRWFEQRLFMCR